MRYCQYACLVLLGLAAFLPLTAADPPRFDAIDKHALAASAADEADIKTLAAYLVKPANNDLEKARAIFRWVADRIAYDSSLLNRFDDNRPETVLKNRRAVCMGYAELFHLLCQAGGVEDAVITGRANIYGTAPDGKLTEAASHRWNAVKLDGDWKLIDSTWGAGFMNSGVFHKKFNDYYFLTPPDKLIFSHWPKDAKWQLLTPPVQESEFEKYVRCVNKSIFYYGVSSADVKKRIDDPNFRELVKPLDLTDGVMTIKDAPLDHFLKAGTKLHFKFESQSAEFPLMAIINQNQWAVLQRKGNVFETTVTLRPDSKCMVVRFKQMGQKKSWNTFLEYVVE